jgi:RNA polymerase sigma-70 factor (ECF subfamily)
VDDVLLVDRCLTGEPSATRELFRRHQRRVHACLYRVLGSNHDMDDLLQDAFLQVFQSLRSWRAEASLGTWIDRVAVRSAYRYLSSKGRRVQTAALADDDQTAGNDAPGARRQLARDGVRRLYAVLDELSPAARLAFTLHEIDGRSLAETASLVGSSVTATKLRVWRARKRLETAAAVDPVLQHFLSPEAAVAAAEQAPSLVSPPQMAAISVPVPVIAAPPPAPPPPIAPMAAASVAQPRPTAPPVPVSVAQPRPTAPLPAVAAEPLAAAAQPPPLTAAGQPPPPPVTVSVARTIAPPPPPPNAFAKEPTSTNARALSEGAVKLAAAWADPAAPQPPIVPATPPAPPRATQRVPAQRIATPIAVPVAMQAQLVASLPAAALPATAEAVPLPPSATPPPPPRTQRIATPLAVPVQQPPTGPILTIPAKPATQRIATPLAVPVTPPPPPLRTQRIPAQGSPAPMPVAAAHAHAPALAPRPAPASASSPALLALEDAIDKAIDDAPAVEEPDDVGAQLEHLAATATGDTSLPMIEDHDLLEES